jgi:spermidine synthase
MAFVLILLVLGLSGLIGQIVLLREFLVIASGNELAIGIFLGSWLLLGAAGCLLADRLPAGSARPAAGFALCQALFAAALPAVLYATRCLRELAGASPGEGLSLLALSAGSLLLLLPVAAPHGALFSLACRLRARAGGRLAPGGLVYGWQTLGTLAGGLVLAFWLLPRFHSFRIALGVSSLDLLFCALVLRLGGEAPLPRAQKLSVLAAATAAFLAIGPAAEAMHRASVARQWPGSTVVFYENSVYGNVTVLRSEDQHAFLTDGEVAAVSPVPDIAAVEELAHLALLAAPRPDEVLVLGGGAGGLLREALKHPVRRVDYAELDPLFLEALARYAAPLTAGEFQDPRVSIHRVDSRLFARDAAGRYDAVIIGAGRPGSLLSNRLFTREFFALARARLKPGGVLAFALPGSTAYLDRNRASLNSCVLQAAAEVFAGVRPIPGDTNIFLASDDPALERLDSAALTRRLRARRIRTSFVGPGQLSLRLEKQWAKRFAAALAPVAASAGVNRDFSPRAVIHALADWNAMFSPGAARLLDWARAASLPRLATVVAVLLLAVLAWQRREPRLGAAAAPAALAATGFAGMTYNMALTFAFQALYGYVYLWIGILVSVFMAGAAAASLLFSRGGGPARRAFLLSEAALVLFSAALPMSFQALSAASVPDAALKGAFLVLCLASGALTGAQFPLACRLKGQEPAPLYACDLLGGWLGAVLGGALLLPVLGLRDACLGLAALKLATFIFCGTTLKELSTKS